MDQELRKSMLIRWALEKSRIRKDILFYLYQHGPSYTNDIARGIGANPTNVIGSLRGMGKRYSEELSLINLGLVERKQLGNKIIYVLTKKGKEVVGVQRD